MKPIPTQFTHKTDQLDDGREVFLGQLTQGVQRFRQGAVLLIDAPWGEGKTWFASRWKEKIDADTSLKMRCIILDAFKTDFAEDPFLAITAEIQDAIEDANPRKKKLLASAKNVASKALPAISRIAVNACGKWILGTSNLAEEAQEVFKAGVEEIEKITENYFEEKINGWAEAKKSIEDYRTALAGLAAEHQIIFVVDELDRCSPTYAVRLLERIKHFFEVPGVVFVLMVHKPQLEAAIHGTFGEKLDAAAYLEKFIHFQFRFPKLDDTQARYERSKRYAQYLQEQFKVDGKDSLDAHFHIYLAEYGAFFGLTLRQLERTYIACIMSSYPQFHGTCLCFLKSLQLGRPELFKAILRQNRPYNHEKQSQDDYAALGALAAELTLKSQLEASHGGDGWAVARAMLKGFIRVTLPNNSVVQQGDVDVKLLDTLLSNNHLTHGAAKEIFFKVAALVDSPFQPIYPNPSSPPATS